MYKFSFTNSLTVIKILLPTHLSLPHSSKDSDQHPSLSTAQLWAGQFNSVNLTVLLCIRGIIMVSQVVVVGKDYINHVK